eukprot:3939092-Rhodomonas_salina.1
MVRGVCFLVRHCEVKCKKIPFWFLWDGSRYGAVFSHLISQSLSGSGRGSHLGLVGDDGRRVVLSDHTLGLVPPYSGSVPHFPDLPRSTILQVSAAFP